MFMDAQEFNQGKVKGILFGSLELFWPNISFFIFADLSRWNVANAKRFEYMFDGAIRFNQGTVNVDKCEAAVLTLHLT
jgi:hypothetical protein